MTPRLPKEDVEDLLPLSIPSFFVLFALSDGEKHGYLMMQEITTLSGGRLRMGPATLYTTIQKLVTLWLLEEVESAVTNRRRTYRLTAAGRQVLKAECQRQSKVLQLATAKKVFTAEGEA